TDLDALPELAQGLRALAIHLDPKGADQAAATLSRAMSKTTSISSLRRFAECGSAVAMRLEPKKAAAVCAQSAATLAKIMSKASVPSAPLDLTQGLTLVLTWVDLTERVKRTAAVVTSVGVAAGHQHTLSALPLLIPVGTPVPCRLSDQQLVDLLKQPL